MMDSEGTGATVLSLFRNDPLNRLLRKVHVDSTDRPRPVVRIVGGMALTWGMLAVLTVVRGVAIRHSGLPAESFLLDSAAYAQLLLVVPLLLLAEAYLEPLIQDAGECFRQSEIIPAARREDFNRLLMDVERWRKNWWPDWLCLALGYAATWIWLAPEASNGISTWHALVEQTGEHLNIAGWWDGLVAGPIFAYLIFRWVWKVLLWCWFLRGVARQDLRLFAEHPDRVGGLGFIGDVQSKFGILVFAIGIMVAVTTHRKLAVELASASSFAVWDMPLAFILLAPLIFLAPLLFFTEPLDRAKRDALRRYGILISRYCGIVNQAIDEGSGPEQVFSMTGAQNSYLSMARRVRTCAENANSAV